MMLDGIRCGCDNFPCVSSHVPGCNSSITSFGSGMVARCATVGGLAYNPVSINLVT